MRPDGTNPAKGIERHKENSRKRYLRGDELQRLTAAAKYPDQRSADVIRMLMLLKTFLEKAGPARRRRGPYTAQIGGISFGASDKRTPQRRSRVRIL